MRAQHGAQSHTCPGHTLGICSYFVLVGFEAVMAKRKDGMSGAEWDEFLANSHDAYTNCVKITSTHKRGMPVHGMAETILANLRGIAAITVGDDKYFSTPNHSTPISRPKP